MGKFQSTEYEKHLNWSPMMIKYVDDLPKLSTELDQIKEHKKELEVSIHYSINHYYILATCMYICILNCHRKK